MVKHVDRDTPEDACNDAVQKAIRFAARHGANEGELEWIVQRTGVPRDYLDRTVADTSTVMDSFLSWIYQRLMSVLDHAAAGGTDPLHSLERIFESHVRFVVGNPGVVRLLRHILGNPRSGLRKHVRKIMRVYEHEIAVIVQDAKARGMVRDEISAQAAATMFVGMVQAHLLRMQILENPEMVRDEARTVLELYLNGIRAAA